MDWDTRSWDMVPSGAGAVRPGCIQMTLKGRRHCAT
jgi:hypothetical protein